MFRAFVLCDEFAIVALTGYLINKNGVYLYLYKCQDEFAGMKHTCPK